MPRPRKYAGPLLPGTRSAKVTKSQPKTKVDKKQSKQIKTLQKQVKQLQDTNSPEQLEYETQYTTVGLNGAPQNMVDLINYDNAINYNLSSVISRTFKSMNVRVHIRGDQSGTQNDSHRPIRCIFFLYKCDVVPHQVSGSIVVAPTLNDLFDGVSNLSHTNLAMSRMSFRNKNRIRILKDKCFSLTNHSGEENDRIISLKYYFKHKSVYENVSKNSDLNKSSSFWMPYFIILDPYTGTRCQYSLVNQLVATTEV